MWFYVHNTKAEGPVSEEILQGLLRNGVLPGDALIWREGQAGWAPASSVFEDPPERAGLPPVPGSEPEQTAWAAERSATKGGIVLLMLIVLGVLFLTLWHRQKPHVSEAARNPLPAKPSPMQSAKPNAGLVSTPPVPVPKTVQPGTQPIYPLPVGAVELRSGADYCAIIPKPNKLHTQLFIVGNKRSFPFLERTGSLPNSRFYLNPDPDPKVGKKLIIEHRREDPEFTWRLIETYNQHYGTTVRMALEPLGDYVFCEIVVKPEAIYVLGHKDSAFYLERDGRLPINYHKANPNPAGKPLIFEGSSHDPEMHRKLIAAYNYYFGSTVYMSRRSNPRAGTPIRYVYNEATSAGGVAFVGYSGVRTQHCSFADITGQFDMVNGTPDRAKLQLVINTRKLECKDARFTKVGLGFFLEVDDFPEATFHSSKITKVPGASANKYRVVGGLRIKEKTNLVAFDADITQDPSAKTATLIGALNLNRQTYGLDYNGVYAISDTFTLKLKLTGKSK